MRLLTLNNRNIAVANDEIVFTQNDFIDLLIKTQSKCNSHYLAIDLSKLPSNFFDLDSGLIENFSQKLQLNSVKMAIFGDFSRYNVKEIQKYIDKVKANKNIFLSVTKQDAIKILQEI